MGPKARKAAAETAPAQEKEATPLLEPVRKVLLAGIGAMALTKDEIEDFVEKLVERGELVEKDARQLMREVMERRKKEAKEAGGELDKRLEDMLSRLNVPTKADIETLTAKVTELSQKVDELKKA